MRRLGKFFLAIGLLAFIEVPVLAESQFIVKTTVTPEDGAAEIKVVTRAFRPIRGRTGAPASATSSVMPASCWLWIPQGRTANSTTHQMMK